MTMFSPANFESEWFMPEGVRHRPSYFTSAASGALREGKAQRAEDILMVALTELPADSRLHYMMGQSQMKLAIETYHHKDKNRALERMYSEGAAWHFARASDLDKGQQDYAYQAGVALQHIGQNKEALVYVARSLQVGSKAKSWALLASLCGKFGLVKEEIVAWENTLRCDRSWAAAHKKLAGFNVSLPRQGSRIDHSILRIN